MAELKPFRRSWRLQIIGKAASLRAFGVRLNFHPEKPRLAPSLCRYPGYYAWSLAWLWFEIAYARAA